MPIVRNRYLVKTNGSERIILDFANVTKNACPLEFNHLIFRLNNSGTCMEFVNQSLVKQQKPPGK